MNSCYTRRLVLCALLVGCTKSQPEERTPSSQFACNDAGRSAVQHFGARMRLVSLLAPDTMVRAELERAYGDVVTSDLLERWKQHPATAPARRTSNPWPARIKIDSLQEENAACRVTAHVVEVTSSDTTTPVTLTPVTLLVRTSDKPRITEFRTAADNVSEPRGPTERAGTGPRAEPAQTLRDYYDNIAHRDFAAAYRLWWDAGRATGKSEAAFAAGFAETDSARVDVAGNTRLEGAAGSQYATVPVVVNARLRSGKRQRFTGTYTLRRSMVDGATEEQREWRIYRASLALERGSAH